MSDLRIVHRPIERIIVRSGQPVRIVPKPVTRIVVRQNGPPGADGAGGTAYEHVQSSPSALWTVNHNLGRRPAAVSVRSPGGVELLADVVHLNANQLQVGFAAPAMGSVAVQ